MLIFICVYEYVCKGVLTDKTGTIFFAFLFTGFSYTVAFGLSLVISIYMLVKRLRSEEDSDDQVE